MRQLLPEPLRKFDPTRESWRRVVQAPREHAHAIHDVDTMNLTYMQQHFQVSTYLSTLDSELELGLSMHTAAAVVTGVLGTALATGIHAFASMSRQLDVPPRPQQMTVDELVRGIQSTMARDAELGRAAQAAFGQLDGLDDLFLATASFMVGAVVERYPEFMRAREELGSVVYGLLHTGACIEFLYTRLASERREEVGLLARLVQKVTGRADTSSVETAKALAEALGLPDEIHPWPRDRRCSCGRSLDPFIFCCKPEAPFDIGPYVPQLAPGFVLERPCCGDRYEGFRCDACGRVSAWAQGVVDTHLEAEEADDE